MGVFENDGYQMASLKRQVMINALDLGTPAPDFQTPIPHISIARLDYERLPTSPKNISSQTHMGM